MPIYNFTPECLARLRRRYEEDTHESVASIAAEFEIGERLVYRLARADRGSRRCVVVAHADRSGSGGASAAARAHRDRRDPPASTRSGANACGIVAAGRAEDGTIYVIADETVSGLPPAGWAARAIALYRRLDADLIVAEVNQGGEMVRAVLREVDTAVPVKPVHATRGKYLRAEPVAAIYAQGCVKHAGSPLTELEDELCDFGLDGLSSGRSPDRLDALVWAVTELMGPAAVPRIRSF